MRVPGSTYRLQLHAGFTLAQATALTDYLHDLGVTDVYTAPLMKARTGSTHGYDITDPNSVNPEIGTLAQLEVLGQELRSRNMGLLLDIVPNHMAASVENAWWRDVLRYGATSKYASIFDIDWSRKLLLPILDKPYGEVLESGEFRIHQEDGESELDYRGLRLPITIPEDADLSNPNGLDRVLSMQPYRLAYWQKARDAMNYRRFFDIGDLVGLRVENDEVFRRTHALIMHLLGEGLATGLRIDHVDGLRDPKCYLERLPPVYVVVEKILAGKETLPQAWRVWGTTGYDFLNVVNQAFIDRDGYEKLKSTYAAFVGSDASIQETVRARKRQVMKVLFAGEVGTLSRTLMEFAEEDWHGRDLLSHDIEDALIRITACLPVYRTYIRPGEEISETDRYHIEDAVAVANRLSPSPAYTFVRKVLLLEPPAYLEHRRCDWLDFVMKWQQFTGPVMAKGFEDTTCYVFNPLTSANEVGADPNGPECSFGVEEFHRRMQERRARWPFTLNAGSTHDTKRSEDVRTRINVLSELPEEWDRCLQKWRRLAGVDIPDANEQCLIYQALLGAWPIDAQRLKEYVTKALREAKTHTSWTSVDEAYEDGVMAFIDRILDPHQSGPFLASFEKLQAKVSFYGAVSSLSQLLLRMTAPGAPDFYQGTEIWNYTLADPDNRRAVDFELRRHMLRELNAGVNVPDLLNDWRDSRLKMYLIWKTLCFRREHPDLFLQGDYVPLRVAGERAENVVAFARRLRNEYAVIIVPRLVAKISRAGRWPTGAWAWRDTAVEFEEAGPEDWLNVLTDERTSQPLVLMQLFRKFPFALLYGTR
jgi:(1->4)-alpha-D-glucan 1-alpha-D-glucosylmutase